MQEVPERFQNLEKDSAGNTRSQNGITKRESLVIFLASMMTAASTLLATVIAKHVLSPVENSQFLIFWAIVFGIFGAISGIQQETTRAVGAVRFDAPRSGEETSRASGTSVLFVAFLFGAVIGAIILFSSPLWAKTYIPDHTQTVVIAISLGALLYAMQSAMIGAAAGLEKWYFFSAISGGEGTWRLLSMLIVGSLFGSLLGLEIAVISAVLLWILLVLFFKEGRTVFAARASVSTTAMSRKALLAMGSSSATAILMMGFPALIKASEGTNVSFEQTALMGILFLAISICRAPIMIPLIAFQGVAISAFLKQKHRPMAAMAKPAGILLGVGALGAAAAWTIGPWLFRLIYPPKPEEIQVYDTYLQGWLLGALVFGSALMALLVLSGTAVIAIDAHRTYVIGWVLAAVVSIALLWLPLDLIPRTLIALYVGPLVGFSIHLIGMKLNVKH